MSEINLTEVVRKLIGPIEPVGETNEDERRYKNINEMTNLVHELIQSLGEVANFNADRVEYSMKTIGLHARNFLSSYDIKY